MIKKADLILAAILILSSLAASYFISFGNSLGNELEITSQGKVFGTYSLFENQTIRVKTPDGHFNVVRIKDGCASVDASDCPGKDCTQSYGISKGGETIVCLPNKLILEINGGSKAYDSISK